VSREAFDAAAQKCLSRLEAAAERDPLLVQERRNLLTGQPGLIVTDGDGNMLAELLSPTGALDDDAKRHADWLTECASRGALALVVHAPKAPSRGGALAFATVMRQTQVEYLARLLLHGRDLAQWDFALRYWLVTLNPG
jgi:hypothetical protein